MLDLEMFSRALRLRWLWFQWSVPDRPWVGMEVPCSKVDRQLFRMSTLISLGSGRTMRFWESSWCDGQAPMDFALNLYKLSWRKHLSVKEELHEGKCTRGLWRMSTAEEMAEFVVLWSKVHEVHLSDQPDQIRWRWTNDGNYSAKSAYNIQFAGSYCSFNSNAIWQAKVEGKHHMFTWLLVQGKILTADMLMIRNIQCNPVCALCDQEYETAAHLCLHCVFAREVRALVVSWSESVIVAPVVGMELEVWWNLSTRGLPKECKRQVVSLLMYTTWNIWKERNRCIFDGKSSSAKQVLNLIKEEI